MAKHAGKMFKASRWRSEKNKIKDVFKLQFQATQVPDLGWDSLMVCLVPEGVGKPAAKSNKAAIQEGNCRWENPIYHTVKFTKESKSGKLNNRIYRIALLTGSSKGSFLGEVAINFADFVEAIEPLCLSQPIKTVNTNIVLHVPISQLGSWSSSQEREPKEKILSLHSLTSPSDGSFQGRLQVDEAHDKTSYKNGESDCIIIASSFSDSTLASNSILGQETPEEPGLKSKNVHQDVVPFPFSVNNSPNPLQTADSGQYAQQQLRLNMECSVSSAMEGSLDDSTSSSGISLLQERFPTSDISIENLKNEMVVLSRQAEVSQLELQTLRKQIVKERRKGQDLSREVHSLKQERDDLREECERLKSLQQKSDSIKFSNGLRLDSKDLKSLLVEIERELDYAKDLNSNLQMQLLKTQESNSELIQTVRNLEEQLERKNMVSEEKVSSGNGSLLLLQSEINPEGQDLKLPDIEFPLKWKVAHLHGEVEAYKKDHEELEMQLEQLALDYEILKQENHQISLKLEQSQLQEQLSMPFECYGHLEFINDLEAHVQSLEKELEKRTEMQFECSAHLASIKDLEAHVQRLEKELEKMTEAFEADLAAIGRDKVSQEQRAIRLENELRKTRWNNFSIAERLQEEFNRLEMQMSSALVASEKQAMQAVTEANELRLQKILQENLLEKAQENIELAEVQFEAKLKELLYEMDLQIKQKEKLTLDLEEKSCEVENLKNSKEERERFLLEEIAILQNKMQRLDEEKIKCREEARGMTVGIVQTVAERHSDEFNEMKHCLLEDCFEKESPRKQISYVGYAEVGVGNSSGLKDGRDKSDKMSEPEPLFSNTDERDANGGSKVSSSDAPNFDDDIDQRLLTEAEEMLGI
ncbi:hypothetical protein ACLOJK_015604 [Asimina triloba]